MIRKSDKEKSIFMVVSADWECINEAKSPEEAASLAVEEVYAKYEKNLNLSPTITTYNVSSALNGENLFETIISHYTPMVLSDIGMHELSKKYKNVLKKLLKNDS